MEQAVQGESRLMIRVKAWKDDDGYALEFEDSRVELSEDGVNDFCDALRKLQDINVGDGETLTSEFWVDLEDHNGE